MRMVQQLRNYSTYCRCYSNSRTFKSVDVQEHQESTVTFNGGTTTLDGKQVTVDIDLATFTLLDETKLATSVPARDLVEMLLVHIL